MIQGNFNCFLGRVFGNIHLYIFHISLGSFFLIFSHVQYVGEIQSLFLPCVWEEFLEYFPSQFLVLQNISLGRVFLSIFFPPAVSRENPITNSCLGKVLGKFPIPIPGWVCKTFPWEEFLRMIPTICTNRGKIQPLFLPWEEFLGNFPSQILGGSVNHILG